MSRERRRWKGSGRRISDFHFVTSKGGLTVAVFSGSHSLLFLLAFLLPWVKDMLRFRFHGRVWMPGHLLTMTRQFIGLGVSVLLGMSFFIWMRGKMDAKVADHAGYSQHPAPFLPSNLLPVLLQVPGGWALQATSPGLPCSLVSGWVWLMIVTSQRLEREIYFSFPLCFSTTVLALS